MNLPKVNREVMPQGRRGRQSKTPQNARPRVAGHDLRGFTDRGRYAGDRDVYRGCESRVEVEIGTMIGITTKLLPFLMMGICVFSVSGQTPPPSIPKPSLPPPPKPAIFSAPKPSEIEEFTSGAGNFKISFPGKPQTDIVQKINLFITTYYLYREGSRSMVRVTEATTDLSANSVEITKNYEKRLEEAASRVSGASTYPLKLVSERDIKMSGLVGKEITYEAGLQFTKLRILFAGKIIYELMIDVTNWPLLKSSHKDTIVEFEKESDRFFNSFVLK